MPQWEKDKFQKNYLGPQYNIIQPQDRTGTKEQHIELLMSLISEKVIR